MKIRSEKKMVSGLETARKFHEVYERLAPSFGYATRADTKAFDPKSANGRLMTAVCQEVCDQVEKSAFQSGFNAGLLERK
jgi:hypothetical protein